MTGAFYLASLVAVVSTGLVITSLNAVHALLYLIVSFLGVAVVFFLLGAPFIAMLEIIIYAGAIMVLFVFVVMMLNLGRQAIEQESAWLMPRIWVGPSILSATLLVELLYLFGFGVLSQAGGIMGQAPKQVSVVLLGPYLIGVELASMLLLPGLVGAYHLGRDLRNEDA
ncbi:MAG TPA: NADH-quinone oxidoreductase subunit J [Nitrospira sp.]|nr:NADH-quinone oxidoreductase subunit J [Nitrospira sp.]